MYYKEKYGITYFYEPESNLPEAATAPAKLTATTVGTNLIITGSNTVLETANYEFTFPLDAGNPIKVPGQPANIGPTLSVVPPKTYDYIAFKFPDSMFDKYATYSATTDKTGFLYIFGISNMIYFTPTTT